MSSSSESIRSYKSHGKLLLFGEHAAVHGYPALGVSLDSQLLLEIHPIENAESGMPHQFPGLNEAETQAGLKLIENARKILPGIELVPSRYRISGDIPRSSGFGSSAAVCMNLGLYLLDCAIEQDLDLEGLLPRFQHSKTWPREEQLRYQAWFLANELEKVFHGSPSGIDTGLTAWEGIHAFFPRSRRLPDYLSLPHPGSGLNIIYGALPRQGNTKALVGAISKAMLEEQPRVIGAMEKLGEAAHQAISAFQSMDEESSSIDSQLGELASRAHQQLSAVGLNTPTMDKILSKAQKMGSSGGKLSGAGGGGAFYFFAGEDGSAEDLLADMSAWCDRISIELSVPLHLLKL